MIEGKYLKKEKPKVELPIAANEVRVTASGRRKAYVDYALRLLEQVGAEKIAIKGMGRATTLTLEVVEAVKRRHPGLHQIVQVDSVNITDDYEPIEEGLKPVTISKRLGSLSVILYKHAPADTSAPGYQPPTAPKEFVRSEPKVVAKAPEAKASEAKVPEATAPEAKATAPDTKVQEMKEPEAKLSHEKIPDEIPQQAVIVTPKDEQTHVTISEKELQNTQEPVEVKTVVGADLQKTALEKIGTHKPEDEKTEPNPKEAKHGADQEVVEKKAEPETKSAPPRAPQGQADRLVPGEGAACLAQDVELCENLYLGNELDRATTT